MYTYKINMWTFPLLLPGKVPDYPIAGQPTNHSAFARTYDTTTTLLDQVPKTNTEVSVLFFVRDLVCGVASDQFSKTEEAFTKATDWN